MDLTERPIPTRGPVLLLAVTDPISAWHLLRGQPSGFTRRGYDVHLLSSPGPLLERVALREGVCVHGVPMSRNPSPVRDLVALVRIVALLSRLRPAIVNAGTPKAGLLTLLAAAIVGVPVRVYTLRGLRLETERGWRRVLLRGFERLTVSCAHRVLCVSLSLREAYRDEGLGPSEKAVVLAHGSSNGIDPSRFADLPSREAARRKLGVPADAPVLGFVGRIHRDKGVPDLLRVFQIVRARFPDAVLVVVGDEDAPPTSAAGCAAGKDTPGVVWTGYVEEPAPIYAAMDVLVFPSYREGFPNVPLEAAAAGVPTVGFRATGTVDAVSEGKTGALVTIGDVEGLAAAAIEYLANPGVRRCHGAAARERALRLFRQETLWNAVENVYRGLCGEPFHEVPGA